MSTAAARSGILLALAFAPLACGGGGGGGPSGPDGNGLQVSGTWTETAVIVSNPCAIELPGEASGTLQLTQSGSQLTATSEGVSITGTINTSTGAFTLSGVFTFAGLQITVAQAGTFTSSSSYTAETVFTITDGTVTCVVETMDSGTRQ